MRLLSAPLVLAATCLSLPVLAQNPAATSVPATSILDRFGELGSLVEHQLAPVPLRADISVEHVANTGSNPTRIARDPIEGHLYVAKMDGEILRVDVSDPNSADVETIYRPADHGLSQHVLGMDFAPNGDLYLLGNIETSTHLFTLIKRGKRIDGSDQREWSILAQTEVYLRSRTAFDHKASALTVSPDGAHIYYNSGSRTDHGEEHEGVREEPLTAIILRVPTAAENVLLPNDRAALLENGYLFAEGVRNHFDLAFAPDGALFGTENSGDRDDSEEINWLREGHHYGFPWRIGTSDTPQQFEGYDPASDPFISRRATAFPFFKNDPTYPPPPAGVTFTDPILNVGPDADQYRHPETGEIRDASEDGFPLRTLTAHRSPLGLVFDLENALAGEFTGDGFFLSWTGSSSSPLLSRMDDPGEDLHHLELTRVDDNYEARITRVVSGFQAPIDAVLHRNQLYVLEYGGRSVWRVTLPATSVATDPDHVPSAFSLRQNYPNPFNPSTQITFTLPATADVSLTIHDALGRELLRPADGVYSAGTHRIHVNLDDHPSGAYFYRLRSGSRTETRSMVLIR